jgi:hypothetical protein
MRLKTLIQLFTLYKKLKKHHMKFIAANWKTTLAGIIVVACAGVAATYPQYAGECKLILSIAGGLGLVAAKDGNVTGGTSQQ